MKKKFFCILLITIISLSGCGKLSASDVDNIIQGRYQYDDNVSNNDYIFENGEYKYASFGFDASYIITNGTYEIDTSNNKIICSDAYDSKYDRILDYAYDESEKSLTISYNGWCMTRYEKSE